MPATRVVATAAALVALLAVVGTLTYVTVRDDDPPPPTTTTTTTTSVPTDAEVAEVVTDALAGDLDVPLDPDEARCVAEGLISVLGSDRLLALADGGDRADGAQLSDDEEAALIRTVVLCVPADTAAALLGTGTTTTAVAELPDEGEG